MFRKVGREEGWGDERAAALARLVQQFDVNCLSVERRVARRISRGRGEGCRRFQRGRPASPDISQIILRVTPG